MRSRFERRRRRRHRRRRKWPSPKRLRPGRSRSARSCSCGTPARKRISTPCISTFPSCRWDILQLPTEHRHDRAHRDDKAASQHGRLVRIRIASAPSCTTWSSTRTRRCQAAHARLRVQRPDRSQQLLHAQRSLQLRGEGHPDRVLHDRAPLLITTPTPTRVEKIRFDKMTRIRRWCSRPGCGWQPRSRTGARQQGPPRRVDSPREAGGSGRTRPTPGSERTGGSKGPALRLACTCRPDPFGIGARLTDIEYYDIVIMSLSRDDAGLARALERCGARRRVAQRSHLRVAAGLRGEIRVRWIRPSSGWPPRPKGNPEATTVLRPHPPRRLRPVLRGIRGSWTKKLHSRGRPEPCRLRLVHPVIERRTGSACIWPTAK